MDYFNLAVELTRAEAAPTLAKLAAKHRAIQQIAADSHERMLASLRADHIKRALNDTYNLDATNAEERACFDRAAARAINSGAW